MRVELNQVTIVLEDDDIYNLWDILSFYKDYCSEHPERVDAVCLGKKELVDKLIDILKTNA